MSVLQKRNFAKEITLTASYVKEEIGFPANNMSLYNADATNVAVISLDGTNPALYIGPGKQVTLKDFGRVQRCYVKGNAGSLLYLSVWKSEDR